MRNGFWLALFCLLPVAVRAEAPRLLPKTERQNLPRTMEGLPQAPAESKPKGEKIDVTTVVEPDAAIIDLRPPAIPLGEFSIPEEPSWLNELIDDHILIWHQNPLGTQVVPKGATDFGITSLGIKFDAVGKGPMWITGNFIWNFLSGPGTAAVAAQTYDLGIDVNYAKKLNDSWGVHLSVSPFFASDFDNNSRDAFRLQAGGLLTFQADEATKFVAGLTYLDRPDLNFLPIAGLKWMLTEDLQLDVLVPRPRIAWRFDKAELQEKWLFLGGEVGGGSWAIEREPHLDDRMGYRDLRCLGGIEYKQPSGGRSVLEAGYVFNRRIEFQRGPGDTTPGNTFVIRWGQLY